MKIGLINANNFNALNSSKKPVFAAKEPILKDEYNRGKESSYRISDYDFAVGLGVPILGTLAGTFLGHIHNCSDNIINLNKELLSRMNVEITGLSKYIQEAIKPLVMKFDHEEGQVAQQINQARATGDKAFKLPGLDKEAEEIKEVRATLRELSKKEIAELNKLESMKKLIENYKKQNLRTFAVVGMFSGIALGAALLVAKHKHNMTIQQEGKNESQSK